MDLLKSLPWLFLVGCAPTLGDFTPYVDAPRVLAVAADPPEAEAGDEVSLLALYADAGGALEAAPLDWSYCMSPKPLAELGPVAESCLASTSADLQPIGSGIEVTGAVPDDACSRFGPNPPPPEEGEPAGRPADPDVTGGYYQPALAFADDGRITLAPIRVRCGLANVSQETYIAWNQGYVSNLAPQIAWLTADGVPMTETPIVPAGSDLTLTVAWDAADAETYVVYDPPTDSLVERREGISVTWFTTAGELEFARTGRAGDDLTTSSQNGFVAPDAAGEVWIAVVLRDERGGVSFGSARLAVE